MDPNDDNNTPGATVPQGGTGAPGEGAGNVSEADAAKLVSEINQLTGRQFKDLDALKTGIKSTFDYVGKAGNYQKVVETLVDKLDLGDEKGVLEWVNSITADGGAGNNQQKPSDPNATVVEKLADLEFKEAHPELKDHLPVIKKLAKADNVSYDEVVKTELFQDYLKAKTSAKETPENSIIDQGNNRVNFQNTNAQQLAEKYQQTGNISDAEQLVAEVLGLGK